MIHLGIDHHKKYSHAVAMNDLGTICWDGQLASTPEAFRSLKEALPAGEPIQCVLEAGRNWGILYDALEELEMNPKLANPLKMRLIAETLTKTDKIDATTHAIILKAGLTPLVHVPSKEIRDQKNLLRQRAWLVKLQTMLKNRIHNVIDRNHLTPPDVSDMFGARGRAWMNALALVSFRQTGVSPTRPGCSISARRAGRGARRSARRRAVDGLDLFDFSELFISEHVCAERVSCPIMPGRERFHE